MFASEARCPARIGRFIALAIAIVVSCAGCFRSTPVTPAPAEPAVVAEISERFVGTWYLTSWRNEGGQWRDIDSLWMWNVNQGGQLSFVIGDNVPRPMGWRLDGRNLTLTEIFNPGLSLTSSYRFEEWGGGGLVLFNYDLTRFYRLSKQPRL